jgi:hypothetical protein
VNGYPQCCLGHSGNGESCIRLYERAVDLLAFIRARAEKNPHPTCIAFRREFTPGVYDWELDHFRRYALGVGKGERHGLHILGVPTLFTLRVADGHLLRVDGSSEVRNAKFAREIGKA